MHLHTVSPCATPRPPLPIDNFRLLSIHSVAAWRLLNLTTLSVHPQTSKSFQWFNGIKNIGETEPGRFQKAHPKQALFSIPKALDPILSFTLLEAFLAISGRKIMAFKHSYPQVAAATMKLQLVPSSCNGTRLSIRWSGCNCHLPGTDTFVIHLPIIIKK